MQNQDTKSEFESYRKQFEANRLKANSKKDIIYPDQSERITKNICTTVSNTIAFCVVLTSALEDCVDYLEKRNEFLEK